MTAELKFVVVFREFESEHERLRLIHEDSPEALAAVAKDVYGDRAFCRPITEGSNTKGAVYRHRRAGLIRKNAYLAGYEITPVLAIGGRFFVLTEIDLTPKLGAPERVTAPNG